MADRTCRILVIDDEVAIRRLLHHSLSGEAYELIEASSGAEGLHLLATKNPDLLLLDLGLPDTDGLDVLKQLRDWSEVPVVVLSARDQEQQKVAALDAGADDYLTKPFGVEELLARIRVGLRRSTRKDEPASPTFSTGGVEVDFLARVVRREGVEVHLTPNEFKLLTILIKHAGRVVTHKQLLREVWGPAYEHENHYLRVYMGQLRHKLEKDPSQPQLLTTESGVGYRLQTA